MKKKSLEVIVKGKYLHRMLHHHQGKLSNKINRVTKEVAVGLSRPISALHSRGSKKATNRSFVPNQIKFTRKVSNKRQNTMQDR